MVIASRPHTFACFWNSQRTTNDVIFIQFAELVNLNTTE